MDSDSDDDSTARRSRVAALSKRSTPLDLDSDSDDSLLVAPKFRKKRRTADPAKVKADSIIAKALKSCQENVEQCRKMSQLEKKNNLDGKKLVESARVLPEQVGSNQKPKSRYEMRAMVEGTDTMMGGDREKNLALVEAADTQLTSSFGSRRTLSFRQPSSSSSADNPSLPRSQSQALEYLEHLLLNEMEDFALKKMLLRHAQKGTLHKALLTGQLARRLQQDDIKFLPKSLLQWMFLVACSSADEDKDELKKASQPLELLARGAYLTLVRLWRNNNSQFGFPQKGHILALKDMATQLDEWFGLGDKSSEDNSDVPSENEDQNGKTSSTSQHPPPRREEALCRWLHLWQLCLSPQNNMVHLHSVVHAKKSLVALSLTSLDPLFESPKTRANGALSRLQQCLAHVLELAAKACTDPEYVGFVTSVTCGVVEAVSFQLGGGLPGSEDESDTHAWLCQARVIRNLLSSSSSCASSFSNTNDNRGAEMAWNLAMRVLKDCLQIQDFEAELQAALVGRWKLPERLQGSKEWRAIATSSLALVKVSSKISDEHGPLCLAVVEISHLCLQAGVAMFENRLATYEEDCEYFLAAFEELEKLSHKVGLKSNIFVLSNGYLLRTNYYVNCIRQFPRLGKDKFQTMKDDNMQSTLDTWVSQKS